MAGEVVIKCSIVEEYKEKRFSKGVFSYLFRHLAVDGETVVVEDGFYELMSGAVRLTHSSIDEPVTVELDRYNSDSTEYSLITITLALANASCEKANRGAQFIKELALAWVERRGSLIAQINDDDCYDYYKGRKLFPTEFGWWNWYGKSLHVKKKMMPSVSSGLYLNEKRDKGTVMQSSAHFTGFRSSISHKKLNKLHMEYISCIDLDYYNMMHPGNKKKTKEMIEQIVSGCCPLSKGEYYKSGFMMSKCPDCGRGLLYSKGDLSAPPTGSYVSFDVSLFCPACGEFHSDCYVRNM